MKIHGRHHGDEVAHALGMQGCEAQAEHPSLTNAEQVERGDAAGFQDLLDAARELALQIVLETREAVRAVRIAPIDQIDIETAGQQPPDKRALGLEVHHVGPIHERINDEQRNGARQAGNGAITI